MSEPVNMAELHSFVLEGLPAVPTARRIVILRALAAVIGSADLAKKLRQEADDLETIEKQHAEILAYLHRKQNPGSN